MKFKTFKQLNAERAGWRAHLKRRSRVFKENQKRLKTASSQAGGPAPKESGFKQLKLTSDKLIGYYRNYERSKKI